MNRFFVALFLLPSVLQANVSDTLTLKGLVLSEEGPIGGAIVLFEGGFSSGYRVFSITDTKGGFNLLLNPDSLPGILKISAMQIKDSIFYLPKGYSHDGVLEFRLKIDTNNLIPVEIKAKQPVTVRGDTTTFDVQSFVSGTEQNLQEVLESLPGFSIDSEGNVIYRGKKISKVLIDNNDLAGSNYQQIIKKLSSTGLEEIDVIDNYTDDDDFLAGNLYPKSTVLNLRYSDSLKGRVFGQIAGSIGIHPNLPTDNDGQLISLNRKIKLLALTGFNNIGKFNNQSLQPINSNSGEISNSKLFPDGLGNNWPSSFPFLESTTLLKPQSEFIQIGASNQQYKQWKWRTQTQYQSDKGVQQMSLSSTFFTSDSAFQQSEFNSQFWNQNRVTSWSRFSNTFNNKYQLIIDIKYKFNQIFSYGNYDFQEISGTQDFYFKSHSLNTKIILNKVSPVSQPARAEILLTHYKTSGTFDLGIDSSILEILPTLRLRDIMQFQQIQYNGIEFRKWMFLGQKQNWRIEILSDLNHRQQNLIWNSDSGFISNQIQDSLNKGVEDRLSFQMKLMRRFFYDSKFSLTAATSLLGTIGKQKHPFFGENQIQKILVLPTVQLQYKMKNNFTMNFSSGFQPLFSNWPNTLQGIALNSKSSILLGTSYPEVRASFNLNFILSKLVINSKKPSIFLVINHNSSPLFTLGNFLPGLAFNRFDHQIVDRNFNITTASIQLQSPITKIRFIYSVNLGSSYFKNYNIIIGSLQTIPLTNHQIGFSLKWKPSDLFSISLGNQLNYQYQKVEGKFSGNAITNIFNLGTGGTIKKNWTFEVKGGHFLNKGGATTSMLPFWSVEATRKLGNFVIFSRSRNVFNVQAFQTKQVYNGSTILSEVNLFPRYVLCGIRYIF